MSMSVDERAKRHHEVDIFVAIDIPYTRSPAALEHDGSGSVHGSAARRRVHAFDQRLLGADKPFRGSSPALRWFHRELNFLARASQASPIHNQRGSSHKRGCVTGKVERGLGDLLGSAD